MPHSTVSPDGSFSFEAGVDSQAVTTLQSSLTPNGLPRNALAWLTNGTVRGGGITPRTGWQPVGKVSASVLYQGGILYEPIDGSEPYFLFSLAGHIFQYRITANTVRDLTAQYPASGANPPTVDQGFWVQAEEFAIWQPGDGKTLPLFWDGEPAGGFGLRRSKNITNPAVAPGTNGVNEIPAATCMDYYMGRLWYAQGHTLSAGDIVKGPSGTALYNKRDAVLQVTENPLCLTGDGFSIPDNGGNIRALFHNAQLNTSLGQGLLYVGTRKAVYSLQVPVTRNDWTGADANNAPQRNVVQRANGPVNDRSVVLVNGDVFYQSLEPGIRSLFLAIRNDANWGNRLISRNISRAMRFNDRSLMRFSSGINFDNRLLQAILPTQLASGNVIHQALAALDFDIISNLSTEEAGSVAPAWEGTQQGLWFLQLFTGDFGGVERAFAAVVSEVDQSIQVWELTTTSRTDNGDNRVTTVIEFPAYTGVSEFQKKRLRAAKIFVDKILGTVELTLNYRQDMDPVWKLWSRTSFCSARNTAETLANPITTAAVYPYPYPGTPFCENYCFPITFGEPPAPCSPSPCNQRPSNIAYQFQPQLIIKGWARVRGILLYTEPREEALYEDMPVC
jgi:hypothetical protein